MLLDLRIINQTIVTVTVLIMVLMNWNILPTDFALPVICTILCHFGHFLKVVYTVCLPTMTNECFLFFLLNVNTGMQAVQDLQSL